MGRRSLPVAFRVADDDGQSVGEGEKAQDDGFALGRDAERCDAERQHSAQKT
jgi:hypothetical protein